MRRKSITTLALAAALALALTACGGDKPADDGEETAGVAVQALTVSAGSIAAENRVSGQISADNERTIMIASTAKCSAVYFEAGDQVKAGDILCTLELDSTLSTYNAARINYQATVQSYNDQKAILDKQVQMAADNVENTKALFEIGAASRLEVDQAELNYSTAVAGRNSALAQLEAGMQSASSNLEQLDTALENVDARGNVIAPISGTLVTMNAVENGFVSNAMPLAVIDGPDQMKLTVSVSEALVPKLAIGSTAEVYVSAVDKSFSAVIRSVEQAVNLQTRLYTVTLTVPADVEGLLSGMFADVTFFTDVSENTVVVPTEAILTRGETQYVFVVDNGAARYAEVTTGLTGNGVTEVTSGLAEGELLVTVGQSYLSDGAAVRIVSGGGAPAGASADAAAGGRPSGEE